MAESAASSEAISTKPNPLERFVARSIMTCELSTWPASENASCKSWSVTVQARFPTYNLRPIAFSPAPSKLFARAQVVPRSRYRESGIVFVGRSVGGQDSYGTHLSKVIALIAPETPQT